MDLALTHEDVVPYAIGDEEEEEEAAGSLPTLETGSDALHQLSQLEHVPALWEEAQSAPPQPQSVVSPGQVISRQMAYRVMRDAVSLQLARRGFDGLRGTALWLVAELAADFTRAIGHQLAQVAVPSPYTDASLLPLVRRLQRHTLLFQAAEWNYMSAIFARSANQEPLQGSVYAQVMQQQQPWRGGPPPPKAVQALYATMRGAWHYKQTGAGRAAHVQAGQADNPPPVDTKQPALLAHSLRLTRKQRQLADHWVYHCQRGQLPMLLPGLPASEAASAADAPVQKGRKRKTPAADSKAAAAAAAAAAAQAAGGAGGGLGGGNAGPPAVRRTDSLDGLGMPPLSRMGSSGSMPPLMPEMSLSDPFRR